MKHRVSRKNRNRRTGFKVDDILQKTLDRIENEEHAERYVCLNVIQIIDLKIINL